MKKLLSVLMAALMLLGCAVGIREADAATVHNENEAVSDGFQTIGDVWDYESSASGSGEGIYVRIFVAEGVFYRAEAELSEDLFQQLIDVDIFDPEAEQKEKALLVDLPIRNLYNLSEALLSQQELDALVGKTGQELLDMGFVPQGSYGFSEEDQISWASLDKGPFDYEFSFVEYVTAGEDPNVAEVIRPLTVKSASFSGNVSDYASDPVFDINGGRTLEEYEAMFTEADPVFYSIPEIPLEDSPFKTLADVFAVIFKANDEGETPNYGSSSSENAFVAAFKGEDGIFYRVEADMTPELYAALDAIDFFDEQKEQKILALIGDLPVTRVGNLSAALPTQEELDALIGKTGEELLDMGFEYGAGYSFWDSTDFYLTRGLADYQVTFNEKMPEMDDYDAVLDELFRPLTVQKVQIDGLSSICSDIDLFW